MQRTPRANLNALNFPVPQPQKRLLSYRYPPSGTQIMRFGLNALVQHRSIYQFACNQGSGNFFAASVISWPVPANGNSHLLFTILYLRLCGKPLLMKRRLALSTLRALAAVLQQRRQVLTG
jgi:hypothetical protein